jgi:hypothetical protein
MILRANSFLALLMEVKLFAGTTDGSDTSFGQEPVHAASSSTNSVCILGLFGPASSQGQWGERDIGVNSVHFEERSRGSGWEAGAASQPTCYGSRPIQPYRANNTRANDGICCFQLTESIARAGPWHVLGKARGYPGRPDTVASLTVTARTLGYYTAVLESFRAVKPLSRQGTERSQVQT